MTRPTETERREAFEARLSPAMLELEQAASEWCCGRSDTAKALARKEAARQAIYALVGDYAKGEREALLQDEHERAWGPP